MSIARPAALAAALLFVVSALSGCSGSGSASNEKAHIRFVNLVVDQATLGVTLDDKAAASAVAFQGATDYVDFASDTYDAEVIGSAGSVLSTYSAALGQKHYTTYYYGVGAALGLVTIDDEPFTVSDGKFVVRAMLLSPVLPGFDVYLTTADTDLSTVNPTLYATASGSAGSYTSEMTSGTWRLRLTPSGAKTVVFDTTQEFAAKSVTTLAIHSVGSAQLPTVLRMPQAEGGTPVLLPSTLARVRAVFGTPDATASRLTVDGATTFQSVPFGGITNFVAVTAGSKTIAVAADGAAGSYASLTTTLVPGHDYTLVTRGQTAAAGLLAFDENATEATATGTANARFVNATLDQAAVDVVVNYQALLSALGAGNRSTMQALTATSYPLSYYASNGSLLATQTTDELVAGGDYRFLLVGAAGQYLAVGMRND